MSDNLVLRLVCPPGATHVYPAPGYSQGQQLVSAGSVTTAAYNLRCYNPSWSVPQQNALSITFGPETEVNNLDPQTPGTRPELVQVTSSLEGHQQVANQIYSAVDFGMAAMFVVCLIVGFKFGANTANRGSGRGGDL